MKLQPKDTPLIQQTADYSMFRPHGEQQAMQPAHVKRLVKSMSEHGFISANAIHVYKDKDSYRVIDGHHRLRAAQALGISVFYIVGDKSDADLIAVKNWAVRKWKGDSFIHMYASRGIESYVKLVSYIKRGLPTKYAVALLSNETTGAGNQNESLRAGVFKIKTTQYADEVIHVMDRLSPLNPEARSATFISALAILLRLDSFSSAILIARVEANPRDLVKCATREQMLRLIEEIYNFRSREKVSLAFHAAELLKHRQITRR